MKTPFGCEIQVLSLLKTMTLTQTSSTCYS